MKRLFALPLLIASPAAADAGTLFLSERSSHAVSCPARPLDQGWASPASNTAALYVYASARAGRWLIPAQLNPEGLDDPQNFDLTPFGLELERLVKAG